MVIPISMNRLFCRELTKSFEDSGPTLPGEEVLAKLLERIERRAGHEPPSWKKVPYPS